MRRATRSWRSATSDADPRAERPAAGARADRPLDLDLPAVDRRPSAAEIAAAALGFAWLIGAGATVLWIPAGSDAGGSGRWAAALPVVMLPPVAIWVAAATVRAARLMRLESRRMQIALDTLRRSVLTDRQSRGAASHKPAHRATDEQQSNRIATVERRLDRIDSTDRGLDRLASLEHKLDGLVAELRQLAVAQVPRAAPDAPTARPPAPVEAQPSLALGQPPGASPPGRDELVRALNFPEDAGDAQGVAALRRVLADRSARQLVQASQDVLTLLAQDGLYMDDLVPDRARPEIWRRFAGGERGRAVAGLGGIRDREALARVAVRMREDTIFRDAAHHFLRLFDRMLAAFEDGADDADLAKLAETRTARAFMLLGRAAGTFT